MEQVRNNLFQKKYRWLFMQMYAVNFQYFQKEESEDKESKQHYNSLGVGYEIVQSL